MSFFGPFSRARKLSTPKPHRPRRCRKRAAFAFERLERRDVLSAAPSEVSAALAPSAIQPILMQFGPSGKAEPAWTSVWEPGDGLTPVQMRDAYGVDQISFAGGIVGDGSGQTIAIVDAYVDPNILNDLNTFDQQFSINGGSESLYQQYGASSTFLTPYQPQGMPINAPVNSVNGWGVEISLDVEWVHAMAPGAKILLTEALNDSDTNL